MQTLAVLNVVGLTPALLGKNTPNLTAWLQTGHLRRIRPMLPSVTCSVQATYLTGVPPSDHGIVANGWYFRDHDEIKFWRQSNRLVQSRKLWESLREADPDFTCANLFWWYNMNSTADFAATPRPVYRADGVKIPDILTRPMALRDTLRDELGPFPLFNFWGPNTNIRSSQWIADAAKRVAERHNPTLSLVYLPHLDYNLQRIGPDHPDIENDLREIDAVCGDLIRFYEARGTRVVVLSEYGIEPVNRPVHLNRALREAGLLQVRNEEGGEILIPGESRAFAVADHQIAHIYVRDPRDIPEVKALLESVPGVAEILQGDRIREAGLDHPRSGELIALADPGAWFTYYYWLDNTLAPDFAPTVDIHNKPGFDPAELHLNSALRLPKLRILRRILQKKLGFRYTLDVIPLSGDQVKGSHGRLTKEPDTFPVFLTNIPLEAPDTLEAVDVHDLLFRCCLSDSNP
ncbi:MAG: alkaline phosphatase family protein [Verrucomicrobia bacterium]|nr:alkaline phosphatase family protein [Verrucomicrobiota bacterium]MCH8527101.1 alkaline phosphatase family protein [Kiritimatiellia bacterium]